MPGPAPSHEDLSRPAGPLQAPHAASHPGTCSHGCLHVQTHNSAEVQAQVLQLAVMQSDVLPVLCMQIARITLGPQLPAGSTLYDQPAHPSLQDVPSKMMYYHQTVMAAALDCPGQKYWQANEHLRPLLLHPAWQHFALQTLISQSKVQIWRVKVKQSLRQLDEDSPELQSHQEHLSTLQEQLAALSSEPAATMTKKEAAREKMKLKVVACSPSLTTVQQVWDQFWLVERKLAQGWSYKDNKSMSEQSKLRHGLVGWVLLKLGLKLPPAQGNKHGPYAPLWRTWVATAVQEQLSALETRVQGTAGFNRRGGQLGTLKHTLHDEMKLLQRKGEQRAARRAASKEAAKAARKAARQAAKAAARDSSLSMNA